MIFRARTLITMQGPPILDGGVVVRDGRILAVGPFRDVRADHAGKVTDLGEQLLMPGLINAHCHLDYTVLRHSISPRRGFTDWIRAINGLKGALDDDDYLASIAHGFEELVRWGTTTVLNIESFPELILRLPPPPIRTWWCGEWIDIRSRNFTDPVLEGILRFFDGPTNSLGGFGLSPHAPYTASIALCQALAECARRFKMPFTIHVAESREEYQMFRHAKGPLYDFLNTIGRPMHDCGSRSPLRHLLDSNALPAGALIAHLNEVDGEDLDRLSTDALARTFSIVHCPMSHRFFVHTPFPYEALHARNINVCLGTDSLASNDALNLFAEMRAFLEVHPNVPPRDAVEMATRNPAAALGLSGKIGILAPGAHADLISFPSTANAKDVFETIVNHHAPIQWMYIEGKPVGPLR